MSGSASFYFGILLITLPRFVSVLLALIHGSSLYYPVIGLGLVLNLAYCTWRGDRWAYYALLLLGAFTILLDVLEVMRSEFMMLILSPVAVLTGMAIIVVDHRVRHFLDEQRSKYQRP